MPIAKDLKVMVVDDQMSMRGLTRHSLGQLGIVSVEDAPDGKKAMQLLIANPPDLVISDYNMPVMNGLDLLRAIRSNQALRKTPFILATGRGDKELVVMAAKAGVNNYVIKPFSTEVLRGKIEAVIGKLV
jgi:two-component system, chemotaxis family, chemotaxis protein CheY